MTATATTKKELPPLLKLVTELGPLGIFFFANARGAWIAEQVPSLSGVEPIFIATGAFMIAITLSLGVSYAMVRHIPIMPLISGVVVLIFGALTLWLQDEIFIKLKPTIVNVLFGSILLGGLWFGKPLLRYLFDTVFALDDEGWRKLTLRWGPVFLLSGCGQRSCLADLHHRSMGGLQDLRHPSDNTGLYHGPDAPDPPSQP